MNSGNLKVKIGPLRMIFRTYQTFAQGYCRKFVKYFKLKKTNIDEPVLKAMMQLLQSFLSASIENGLRYLAFLIFFKS